MDIFRFVEIAGKSQRFIPHLSYKMISMGHGARPVECRGRRMVHFPELADEPGTLLFPSPVTSPGMRGCRSLNSYTKTKPQENGLFSSAIALKERCSCAGVAGLALLFCTDGGASVWILGSSPRMTKRGV